MSQREQRKAETHQRIVRSAVGLLRERGLADVSVSDVMAGAGLTVGGFYAHFPSKRELGDAAIRQAMLDRRTQFLDRPDEDGWRLRLQSALQGYFSERHRDDVQGRCPMPMAAVDAARSEDTVPAFAEEMAKMAEAFETGGDPTGPRAPRDAALGSLALMVGGMILAHATKGTPLADEVLGAAARYGAGALEALEGRA
jgi:TetR/AcrR family transcriptional repressor of nem operon